MFEKISKECMEQYEAVRKSGVCNMFDFCCVVGTASTMGFDALAELDRKDYVKLLSNFSSLMSHYGIKQ